MWQKIIDLARSVFAINQQTQSNTRSIEALQSEVKQLTAAIQRLAFEHQRVLDELERMRDVMRYGQQNEQHEREKMALRLENEMLRFERRLPPPKNEDQITTKRDN